MRCQPSGPVTSNIAFVGEAPGVEEEANGLPFIGTSGGELDRMCKDAGVMRESVFITNVTHDRPPANDISLWISDRAKAPDSSYIHYRGKWVKPFIKEEVERLHAELRTVQPNIVVAFGNTPLWALCPQDGIGKWRGSQLLSDAIPNLKVIPTYHPAAILRQYSWRPIAVHDIRRAKREAISPLLKVPDYYFAVRPSLREIRDYLRLLKDRLDRAPTPFTCDIEIFRQEILCVGLGLNRTTAMCIPFIWTKGWYWSIAEHTEIIQLLQGVLCHPNAQVINQNLSFDIQYLFWRFFMRPRAHFDTMIAQNVLFSGMPKDLAFLASMYNEYYLYWKDDGKFWVNFNDEELWRYNCIDCVTTFEIWEKQQVAIEQGGLAEPMAFQMRVFKHLMGMMIRGVKVDMTQKGDLLKEVNSLITSLHEDVAYLTQSVLTGPKGDFSPKKLAHFFYTELGFPAQFKSKAKGGGVTADDEALKRLIKKQLWLRPIADRISMIRSYGTAVDVCNKKADKDGRWRTSYNVAGTTTFRLASSSNPFESGLNLQNLTGGRDINVF